MQTLSLRRKVSVICSIIDIRNEPDNNSEMCFNERKRQTGMALQLIIIALHKFIFYYPSLKIENKTEQLGLKHLLNRLKQQRF